MEKGRYLGKSANSQGCIVDLVRFLERNFGECDEGRLL